MPEKSVVGEKKNVLLAYKSNGLKGVLSGARKAAKILRK